MRLPRLTTRRTMIVVAILALGFAAERPISRLARISSLRQNLAIVHAASERQFRNASGITSRFALQAPTYGGLRPYDIEAERRRRAAWQFRMAEYHGELSRRYERAAWYPWVAMAPNPPRPE